MIRSFKHKGLHLLFERGDGRKVQPEHVERLRDLLFALDTAHDVCDMDLPKNRLHALSGKLQGHYAVTVRSNWRLTFRFEHGDAFIVDYQDYH